MSDREVSRSRSRSRNRMSDRESPRRKRSRSRSFSDRSPSRGRYSRSRSHSYERKRSYRSRTRSRSPAYRKKRAHYDQSPESSEDGHIERYRKNSSVSLHETSAHNTRRSQSRESSSSPQNGRPDVAAKAAVAKCIHFQPFNPNCKTCLSDKRHQSVLMRYNKKMKTSRPETLPDVDVRGHWHPLKRCSRSHSREYQLICRTCKRLGALCLYPAWAYTCSKAPAGSLSPGQVDQEEEEGEEASKHTCSMLIVPAESPDGMREVVILQEGAESVFYEFPYESGSGGKGKEKCDCDECMGSDLGRGRSLDREEEAGGGGSYRDHHHQGKGSYYGRGKSGGGGGGGGGYKGGRRWSTEESHGYGYKESRGGQQHHYQSSRYHQKNSSQGGYDRGYNNERGYSKRSCYDDGDSRKDHYRRDQYYDDYKGSSSYDRNGSRSQQYRGGERSHWPQTRGRGSYGRGRGRGGGQAYRGGRNDYRKDFKAMRENPETSRCVGVFGLSLHTGERDIRDHFSRYGSIEEIQMVYDHHTGRSRGFAFIYYRNLDDAVEAKERGPGTEIDGHKIRVDYSITERAHTPTPGIYLGNTSSRGYGSRRESQYTRRSRSPEYHSKSRRYSRSRSRSYSPHVEIEKH